METQKSTYDHNDLALLELNQWILDICKTGEFGSFFSNMKVVATNSESLDFLTNNTTLEIERCLKNKEKIPLKLVNEFTLLVHELGQVIPTDD